LEEFFSELRRIRLTYQVGEIRSISNISTKRTQTAGKKFAKKAGWEYFLIETRLLLPAALRLGIGSFLNVGNLTPQVRACRDINGDSFTSIGHCRGVSIPQQLAD
jgi:hypothetical protein